MLTVSTRAVFDAPSYYHFVHLVGRHGSCNKTSGLILLHQGELPSLWPSQLYRWSVLLANEPPPSFEFSEPICITFEHQRWLALQASPTASVLSFMCRFGWKSLPICLIAPLSTNAPLLSLEVPSPSIYATGSCLFVTTCADDLPLVMEFETVSLRNNAVTTVTYELV